jgi:CelD/BcsL family acetyltransferase involved in cellulose biosynthesis
LFGAERSLALIVAREELDAIEGEWREMLSRCTYAPVFLSPAWLRTWWGEFGDGRELVLLSVRDGGRLAGVVPLMREGGRLSFAGDTEVCDYMDFPCAAGREADVLAALFRSLGEEPWDDLALWAMREDSPALAALPGVCGEFGFSFQKEAEDVCPWIAVDSGWDEYVESLDKKDRHELRRKLRKLPQAGDVELEVLESPADVEAALDDFLWMHRESRADKAAFMTERMERFFRRLVLTLAAESQIEMIFLKLGGVRVACVLCFRGDGETLLYNSGYHPDYAPFSVGLLSKALALQRAIEQGVRRFDFLRGHERYKYELGAKDLTVYRALVARA